MGKAAKAPCGHMGEHVVGQYIKCLGGCEGAIPEYVRPEKTQRICKHSAVLTYWVGWWVKRCAYCEEVIK